MPSEDLYYRLRIRNRADDDDLLILTTLRDGGENPYLLGPPTGDGQSFDAITGAPTTGSYRWRFADAPNGTNSRVFTEKLADVNARNQMLSLRAYGETSPTGVDGDWDPWISGYVLAARLTTAIEGEIGTGASRRREVSRTMFREATGRFSNVTTVIGGPVLEDFAGLLTDNGGWTYEVAAIETGPDYYRMEFVTGFDPRKSPGSAISSISTAIRDYTNDWARGFFQPSESWTADDIQGNFPKLVAKVTAAAGGTSIFLTPLSIPATPTGAWWGDPASDLLISSGSNSVLYLPKGGVDSDGVPASWAPSLGAQYKIYVYALPISERNPLHVYDHPVDLWEKAKLDAGYEPGIDYDDSNLAALKTSINAWIGYDIRLALRIVKSVKQPEFMQKVIFGPFLLSEREVDGMVQLFSRKVRGTPAPTDFIRIADLRSYDGTIWDIDESTIITAITLKQLRLAPWTTDETKQPEADALVANDWPFSTIENSNTDIPPGLEASGHEQEIGDIPGTIVIHNATPSLIVPLPFEQFLKEVGFEYFNLFGRGAAMADLICLRGIDYPVGTQVMLDVEHRPNAVVGQSPVSQRGGERRIMLLQRTEEPEGPVFRAMDAVVEGSEPVGAGGGSEEETDPTAIGTPADPVAFPNGSGSARADWIDAYPQFYTRVQWEAKPPGGSFSLLYGGEHLVSPGIFADTQIEIPVGWIARCRYQLTDLAADSSFSGYSNEVTISGDSPAEGPVDYPDNLECTSVTADEAHAEWTNSDAILQIKIKWQTSTDPVPGPPENWSNVAGGSSILTATTTSADLPTGPGTYARFALAYVNTSGVVGTWSDWSEPAEIMV